jgi:hypothetical protein
MVFLETKERDGMGRHSGRAEAVIRNAKTICAKHAESLARKFGIISKQLLVRMLKFQFFLSGDRVGHAQLSVYPASTATPANENFNSPDPIRIC